MARQGVWTPEAIELAAGMWADGRSGNKISAALWSKLRIEISRSAVVGYVHRHRDLFARRGRNDRKPAPAKAKPAGAVSKAAPFRFGGPLAEKRPPTPVSTRADSRAYDAASRHLPLVELAWGDCRWPVAGEVGPAEHLFCGLPSGGGSYCPHHASRAGGGYRLQRAA